jgi:hypothetical protein
MEDTVDVWVVDCRTNGILTRLSTKKYVSDMCFDRSGDYVFGCGGDTLLVIDARRDSVVSRTPIPWTQRFVVNRRAGCVYMVRAGLRSTIPVLRDSAVVPGIEETHGWGSRQGGVTVVKRGATLRASAQGVLYDESGRVAAVIKPGENDVGMVRPGVYFMLTAASTAAVKLVIQK